LAIAARGERRVLDGVVEDGGDERFDVQALFGQDRRDRHGVRDVRLARLAGLADVGSRTHHPGAAQQGVLVLRQVGRGLLEHHHVLGHHRGDRRFEQRMRGFGRRHAKSLRARGRGGKRGPSGNGVGKGAENEKAPRERGLPGCRGVAKATRAGSVVALGHVVVGDHFRGGHSSASRSLRSRSDLSTASMKSESIWRAAISRRASTVGLSLASALSRRGSTPLASLARALGGHHHEFEAVVDHFQAIFDG
jgi:hypothetical protein